MRVLCNTDLSFIFEIRLDKVFFSFFPFYLPNNKIAKEQLKPTSVEAV